MDLSVVGRRCGLTIFGIGTPLVCAWLAVLTTKDNVPNPADKRNKGDENPPSAFADIVHATDAYADAGDKDSDAVDVAKDLSADNPAENAENDADDEVIEGEIPKLRTTRTSLPIEKVLPTINVIVHGGII